MKAPPDEVKLSREEGEALIERLRANALTSEDRGLLVKLIRTLLLVHVRVARNQNQPEPAEAGVVWRGSAATPPAVYRRRGDGRGAGWTAPRW